MVELAIALLGFLHTISQWASSIAGIFGLPTAIVTFLITVRRVRRGWRALAEEQQATKQAADAAADRAHESASASREAAKTAEENSRQADATIEWLAGHLARRDAVIDELRDRIDGLLGTRARQVAVEREERPALLVPLDAGAETDPTTVTGRHRLHTQHIPTIDEGDHS